MLVEKVIETPQGKVEFKGELTGSELEIVIAAGLNYLMHAGALPVIIDGDNLNVPEESQIQ